MTTIHTLCRTKLQASAGIYGDESGPEMWRMLETLSTASQWPLSPVKFVTQIVPDDKGNSNSYVSDVFVVHWLNMILIWISVLLLMLVVSIMQQLLQ